MRISQPLKEHLDKFKDGPPLIVGTGPQLDQNVIKRSVMRGSFAGGNHPLPDGVYNEALTGYVVRIYTYAPRRRDKVWILKKINNIRIFERQKIPTRKGDKRMKILADKFAKLVADEYGWFFVEDAKHNQEVPDFYQAYVELGEVINRDS